MFNCHIHTFTENDVPRNFLPLKLVPILRTKIGYFLLSRLLRRINPFSNKDIFDRFCKFIEIGKNKTQEDILKGCSVSYPIDTKFCILSMDMSQMGSGNVPRPYIEQLQELKWLAKNDGNVLPFIHIDPRNPSYRLYFDWAVNSGFRGLKLYPPLGIFPFDDRFYNIYKYCQEKGIPIISHCTQNSIVHFQGSTKKLLQLASESIVEVDMRNKKTICNCFMHPNNYKVVLKDFPNLKICLAHFGSGNEWDNIIHKMMPDYPSLFVDISYVLYTQERWAYLKVLLSTDNVFRNRCLFGSDYYMDSVEGDEKQFSIQLRGYLGEDLWKQIAEINPRRFLKNVL